MIMTDEARLAAEIVNVLDPAVLRACPSEHDVIGYAVRGNWLKLRTIVFDRDALLRLMDSPDADVKIDYLKRDLLRTAMHRSEYRYPRLSVVRTRGEECEENTRAAI